MAEIGQFGHGRDDGVCPLPVAPRGSYNGALTNVTEDPMTPRITRPLTVALSLAVLALCWAAMPARSQDAPAAGGVKGTTAAQDLKALQGRWERPLSGEDDAAKGAARVVKEVKGNRETVTYYDDAGKAVRVTTADFKLETSGRVKLYTFSNLKVTEGQDSGDAGGGADRALSYLYRVEGDLYYEVHGLLIDSPAGSSPSVVRWERAK